MSIQAIGACVEFQNYPGMTPSRKLTLLMLCNAHNGHTGQCFPDQQRLRREVGVSLGTVEKNLKWLEAEKLITRFTVHLGRGKGSKTTYRLNFLDPSFLKVHSNRPVTGEDLDPSPVTGGYKDKPESIPEYACASVGAGSLSAWYDAAWQRAETLARPGAARSALTDLKKYVVAVEAGTVWVNARFVIDKHQAALKDLLETSRQVLKFYDTAKRREARNG